jgi:GxxExxY protein
MLRVDTKLDSSTEDLIYRTIGCCIEVHRHLGPGLLETIYQRAVALELSATGVPFVRGKRFPVIYRNVCLYTHIVDLIVDSKLLLELKAVEHLHPVHDAQTISCLRVSKLQVALLINFNVAVLPQGIRRKVLS